MSKFVMIIGPEAVGKMMVGQELAKLTDLKFMHNHETIDCLTNVFEFGSIARRRLTSLFRYSIFEEVAKSDLAGIIFSACFDFGRDIEEERAEFSKWMALFDEVYVVELEASLEERLCRNKTENRLKNKMSKRDLEKSENRLLQSMINHRLNSQQGEGEAIFPNFFKINNENLSAEEVGKMIQERFDL